MNMLLNIYNKPLEAISSKLEPWLLPTLARFTFVAVLFMYFWASATLKLGDGLFDLSFGAYGQIFPVDFEAAGYDVGQLSSFHKVVAYAGTYAEFVLPVLLAIGLFTRLAALGMIGFTFVQSYVDIYGHMADETAIGTWFDRIADSQIMDQRLFWITLLMLLFIKGAGPLSADKLIGLK
ncbi:MAG: DoxX family protein [Rhodobacteraceae bacterium]|nr:DoxX family protein [Paracoccaceae bacterium]